MEDAPMARRAGLKGFKLAPVLIAMFAAIATVSAKDCCPPKPQPTPTPTATATQTATKTATTTPTATCTPGSCKVKGLSLGDKEAGFTGDKCSNNGASCGTGLQCQTIVDYEKKTMHCCCLPPP
jgi:hypothetical protein